MSTTLPPLQELAALLVQATSTNSSVANHGAAGSPAITLPFTTTSQHPNVDIEVSAAYMYGSVASTPSYHVMIDGTADANCQGEAIVLCTGNFLGGSPCRKFRVTGLAPGAHTLSLFLKMSTAGTVTLTGSAVNPTFIRVTEAP